MMRLWSLPRFPVLLSLFAAALLSCLRAEGDAGELFLQAYMSYRAGQRLEAEGRGTEALQKYRFCAGLLGQLQQNQPDYQPIVVDYRLKKSREAIARISDDQASPPVAPVDAPRPAPSPKPAGVLTGANAPGSLLPKLTGTYRLPLPAGASTQAGPAETSSAPSADGSVDALMRDGALNALKTRVRDLQLLLSNEKQTTADLRQQALETTAREQSALVELDRTKVRSVELQSQLDGARRTIADLQQTNVRLIQERNEGLQRVEQLEADLAVANEYSEELFGKLEHAARFIDGSEKIRSQLLEERSDLARRVAAKGGDGVRLARERDAARKRVTELEQQISTANQKMSDLRVAAERTADDLRKQAAEASGRAAEQLRKLAAEKEEEQKKLRDEKEREIAALRAERATATAGIAELETKLAAAKIESAEAVAELNNAHAVTLRQRDEQVQKLREENERLGASLAAGEKQRAEMELRNKELLAGMDLTDKRVAAAEGDRRQREKLEGDLRGQIQTLEKSLVSLRSQLADGSSRISELEKQLADTASASAAATGAMAEENALLKSIVTKQLAEQSRRQQARKLLAEELERLQIRSDTLVQRLDALASAEAELAPRERAMFESTVPNGRGGTDFVIEKKSPTSDLPAQFAEKAREANQLSQRGQYAQALAIYREIVSEAPDSHFANLNLGVVARQLGDYPLAIRSFERALALKPGDALTLSNLGMSQFRADQGPVAVTTLRKAVEADPQNHLPRYFLALALNHVGDLAGARAEAERSRQLKPDYVPALELLQELDSAGGNAGKSDAR